MSTGSGRSTMPTGPWTPRTEKLPAGLRLPGAGQGEGAAAKGAPRPAVFLDRDGTVTREIGYLNHLSRLELIPGAAEAVRELNRAGWPVVLVSNQAGVARGYFNEGMVVKAHFRLRDMLAEHGAYLDGYYHCPHHPSVGPPPYRRRCRCRKPGAGMLLQARGALGLDLSRSYMVGDKISDVEMALRHGLAGVMVLSGYGRGEYAYQRHAWTVTPGHVAEDLLGAVRWILQKEGAA